VWLLIWIGGWETYCKALCKVQRQVEWYINADHLVSIIVTLCKPKKWKLQKQYQIKSVWQWFAVHIKPIFYSQFNKEPKLNVGMRILAHIEVDGSKTSLKSWDSGHFFTTM